MSFVFKNFIGLYLAWIEQFNKYILLKEPAYRVVRLWLENVPVEQITSEVVNVYHLDPLDAALFVSDILQNIQKNEQSNSEKIAHFSLAENVKFTHISETEKLYKLGESFVKIIYKNFINESLIKAKLQHLVSHASQEPAGSVIEISFTGEYYQIKSGSPEITRNHLRSETLALDLYLQLLFILHNTPPESWMGVCHASAIAGSGGAVLFTAPSGSGKSTLAALLMAEGYELLADDLVPIALTEPEVYQFPAALSVKKAAIPHLKDYFPGLEEKAANIPANHPRPQVYLPFPEDIPHGRKARTKAIVFVIYDPSVDYELTLESNLEMMNDFLEQIWVPANPTSAGRFMDWYFSLPVYSLRYSDNKKVVEGMSELLVGKL